MTLSQRYTQLRGILLALLALTVWPTLAAAQEQHVPTAFGVTLAVPAQLKAAGGIAGLFEREGAAPPVATFTDGAAKPLVVVVQEGAPHGYSELPPATERSALEWADRFAASLNIPQVFDVTPGKYDAERGVVSLTYKVRGPSPARLMLGLPDTHALWAPVLYEGGDPQDSKCLIEWLLGGKPYADRAELRARTARAAAECSYSELDVAAYIDQLGSAEFAPAISTVTAVAFFTRRGTLVALALAPLERAADTERVAATLWERSVIDAEARLPEAGHNPWYRAGSAVGVLLGALGMVFVLGGAAAFLLVRAGLRRQLALLAALGVLVSLSVVSVLRAERFTLDLLLLPLGYALASAVAYRPLERWLRRGPPSQRGLLRDARGLSTVEYVIIAVLLAAVGIGAWRLLGENVRTAIGIGTRELETLDSAMQGARSAAGSDSPGAGSSAPGSGPSTGTGRTTPATGGGPTPVASGARRPTATPPGGPGRPSSGSGQPGPSAGGQPGPSTGSVPPGPASEAGSGLASGLGSGLTPGAAPPPTTGRSTPATGADAAAAGAREPTLLVTGADIATDFTPGVSNVKDATIAVTGVNPVTGERVGTVGRVAAGVFAIPGAGNTAKYAVKGTKLAVKGIAKGGKAVIGWLGRKLGRESAEEAAEKAAREAAETAAREAAETAAREAAETAAREAAEKAAREAAEKAAKEAEERAAAGAVEESADKWSRAPKSIQDQMALEAAKRGEGQKIIDNLNDPKFKGMEKWEYKVKSADGRDSVVHYVRDPKTGELMDFKFKKHSTDGPGRYGSSKDPSVGPGDKPPGFGETPPK